MVIIWWTMPTRVSHMATLRCTVHSEGWSTKVNTKYNDKSIHTGL